MRQITTDFFPETCASFVEDRSGFTIETLSIRLNNMPISSAENRQFENDS